MSPGTHPAQARILSNSMRLTIVTLFAVRLFGAGALDQALARMDQNAAVFKGMSSSIRQLSHTAVINEDNTSTGSIRMRRNKRDAQVVVDLTAPDPKSVALSGTKAEIYYPKLSTVEEYDLGKNKDMVEKFLALGFGASGKDLQADYTLKELGPETVNSEKTLRIELTPKAKSVAQQFPKIELWISEASGYPVQQKLHQTGGDYMMATYSDIKINPTLPDSSFRLSLPRGVKRVFPQK